MSINSLLKRYEQSRPFTQEEAWGLFRIAAITEAFGWTLLISGILLEKYVMHGNNIAVQLAGHIHGVFFLIYITAVIVLHPSQHWSRGRTIIAGIASVPPYGSLLFEQWMVHKRWRSSLRKHMTLARYNLLSGSLE